MHLPEYPVYVANFPVNMNKSIDGLCLTISGVLGKNPTETALYVFLINLAIGSRFFTGTSMDFVSGTSA